MPAANISALEGAVPGFAEALALRFQVFCDEQGIPHALERDDGDDAATHVLLRSGGITYATGRVLRMRADGAFAPLSAPRQPDDRARIGRMAVRQDLRGAGAGARVLRALEEAASEAGLCEAVLHAQLHAEGFYRRCGYVRHGPEFDEAGVAHVQMTKRLG